jgi:hypothetical protein
VTAAIHTYSYVRDVLASDGTGVHRTPAQKHIVCLQNDIVDIVVASTKHDAQANAHDAVHTADSDEQDMERSGHTSHDRHANNGPADNTAVVRYY